ncbi:hypothetical protein PC129_g11428 [Phytophthora cactorum]|uniref:Reverse transcriptase RNase H-like domain-containing protein n=1 Tax=Phytophthora cactorum TaxID=29920 RepID=A0A329SG16_9STRA|nr:hypothetical protein PC112_g19843 [Phytophthora cactorum]KAG2802474.1 hypothetical protein PC111_g19087 [Phytophthora cactorum]KAG2838376.1 hypothetical protein PC113_g19673 [Phytophthora cactorum]KAG2891363.1 hypothetical protein PC115_g19228 [Phytophthora cactorum]KAG2966072.1 hypothetical protein PC118_g19377 [Phytophthora cactorum]
MQEVNGCDRLVAYASKLLTGTQKNWINKQDGISEIEGWGIVWATRKFRCYKREFDLYMDHKALASVFNPGIRTTNAKLARWAMELSRLQFKVHHKPGMAMGHVDGLSRLPIDRVDALTMANLLDPAENSEDVVEATVGEQEETDHDREFGVPEDGRDGQDEEGGRSCCACLRGRYVWSRRGAVLGRAAGSGVDPSADCVLGGRCVASGPASASSSGEGGSQALRGKRFADAVGASTGEGWSGTVPTVPVVPLAYIPTVLHYCHSDLLSHLGLTKTLEKVRRHAYWPGWRKDVTENLREYNKCGSGKGARPWIAGLVALALTNACKP